MTTNDAPATVDPASLTIGELAPFVDERTGLGLELAIEKRNVAILTQRVAELEAQADPDPAVADPEDDPE